jgi:hypothetical protein
MSPARYACLLLALLPLAPARAADFAYSLDKPALTSAGVFDARGRLVTTLWTLRPTPAGRHAVSADIAPGHHVTVVANRATYTNVGAIGNSGRTPDAAGHTPTNIESVAVDKDGNVYTANGWDEAGADFKKWDQDGNAVYDADFRIRNGRPNGIPYVICVDEEYLYCAVSGWEREPWNNRQQIQRYRLKDGKAAPFTGKSEKSSTEEPKSGDRAPRTPKRPSDTLLDGHIQLYEWPQLLIPKTAPDDERRLMRNPIRAMDVAGSTLYAADALAGVVHMFDTETGAKKGEFNVHLPRALAVDPIGQVWVADHAGVLRAYRTDGYSGVTYSGLGDPVAMAFGTGAKLYVADARAGQVLLLNSTPDQSGGFTPVLGQKAKSGDRAPDRFYTLRGLAVDAHDNLITVQREPGASGARLARWTPDSPPSADRQPTYTLAWEHFATEFVSLGNYGQSDPDTLYTVTHHRHRLLDRAKGTWDYLGNAVDLAAFPTSNHTYRSDPHGVPRVLRIGSRDFVFMPTGDGVQVYRANGSVLKLASLVGGHDPSPDGEKSDGKITKWTWSDEQGTGKPDPARIRTIDDRYTCFGMDVDAHANLWFANTHTHSIWTIPLAGVDARGNPRYDWRSAREVTKPDTTDLALDPTMVQATPDGSFYASGWSKPHPQPRNNPFWMGGTTLARYDRAGNLLWWTPTPETIVGMDTIPAAKPADSSAGVIVGGGKSATLYHYTADGLLIGKLSPGPAMGKHSGWLDNHASVAVNRDSRDGLLDVFAEDDFTCRIAWYRIDDREIRTLNATPIKP